MSVIHSFVDSALEWMSALGYWGIMLGLMIEVIPSEIVLAFGGYLVSTGEINYWLAVLFGVIGGVIAQIFVYWIGRYGGRPILEKFGKYILINKHHIDVSEQWFNKYGAGVIFTARFIPVVRHAISVPAGMARMPLSKFTILTTLAVIPWSMFFVYLGKQLGDNWQNIDEYAAKYMSEIMWGAVGLTVLYVAYVLVKRYRRKSASASVAADTAAVVLPSGDSDVTASRNLLDTIGSEYRVLDRVAIEAADAVKQADYIVVGPNGLFHIELNETQGDIRIAEANPGTEGGSSASDPTAMAYRRDFALKNWLRRLQIRTNVVGVICLTDASASVTGQNSAVALLKPAELAPYIRAYRTRQPLSEEQINRIARTLKEQSGPDRKQQ
ncbi:MAG: yngC [Paenibacillus sp.]|nr:yngC [Paenibacillus sp.]